MRSILILAVLLFAPTAHAQSTQALRHFENGLAHSRNGDHAKALTEFDATLSAIVRNGASDRFFAKTHYNLGVSLYQLRRLDASIAQFQKALRYEHNQYEKAHYALGLAQFEKGDISEARKALSNAVTLNNRNG